MNNRLDDKSGMLNHFAFSFRSCRQGVSITRALNEDDSQHHEFPSILILVDVGATFDV